MYVDILHVRVLLPSVPWYIVHSTNINMKHLRKREPISLHLEEGTYSCTSVTLHRALLNRIAYLCKPIFDQRTLMKKGPYLINQRLSHFRYISLCGKQMACQHNFTKLLLRRLAVFKPLAEWNNWVPFILLGLISNSRVKCDQCPNIAINPLSWARL